MAAKRWSPVFKSMKRAYLSGLHPKPCQSLQSNIRGFHATSRRHLLDECLVQTHTLITGIHSITGLPWAASIPLAALLTRAVVIFPFSLYDRRMTINQQRLGPLLKEALRKEEPKIAKTNLGKSAGEKKKIVYEMSRRLLRRLRREHGLQQWKSYYSLTQYPIWFVVMETLRRMTGTEDGMLALVWKSLTGGRSIDSGVSDVEVIPIEKSLVAEGMLWFPNLLLPDPSLMLPFVLSATLFTSSLFFSTRARNLLSNRDEDVEIVFKISKIPVRTSRLQKALALAAGPATLQFPSVMVLYWISSGLCSIGFRFLVLRWMPWPSGTVAAPTKLTRTYDKQIFRGPTMQELHDQKKRQKRKR